MSDIAIGRPPINFNYGINCTNLWKTISRLNTRLGTRPESPCPHPPAFPRCSLRSRCRCCWRHCWRRWRTSCPRWEYPERSELISPLLDRRGCDNWGSRNLRIDNGNSFFWTGIQLGTAFPARRNPVPFRLINRLYCAFTSDAKTGYRLVQLA